MRFDLEYGFNNQSLPKFEEYEIKVVNNIKYVVPKFDSNSYMNYSLISFDDYEENDKVELSTNDEKIVDNYNLNKTENLENKFKND